MGLTLSASARPGAVRAATAVPSASASAQENTNLRTGRLLVGDVGPGADRGRGRPDGTGVVARRDAVVGRVGDGGVPDGDIPRPGDDDGGIPVGHDVVRLDPAAVVGGEYAEACIVIDVVVRHDAVVIDHDARRAVVDRVAGVDRVS